jgi:hypothetical protein
MGERVLLFVLCQDTALNALSVSTDTLCAFERPGFALGCYNGAPDTGDTG